MSAIKFKSYNKLGINPSENYLPYNSGGSFSDSPLWQYSGDAFLLCQAPNGNVTGLNLNFDNDEYTLGDTNSIGIGSSMTGIQLNGTNIISGGSGGFSNQYLRIQVNSVIYKIKLNLPA